MFPITPVSTPRALIFTVGEVVLGLAFGAIWWPFVLTLFMINVTAQFIVTRILRYKHGDTYTISNGEDAVFGIRLKNNCGSLIVGYELFKGVPNVNKIREKFQALITGEHGGKYVRLRSVFVTKLGYFCWEKKPQIDLNHHIRILDSWDANEVMDENRLHEVMGKFSTEGLSTDRPQWEILLVPRFSLKPINKNSQVHKGNHWTSTGNEDADQPHYALIWRFHHSFTDGVSFVLMTNNHLADVPGELPFDPTKPFPTPKWAKLIIWAKVFVMGPLSFVLNMSTFIIAHSAFKVRSYAENKYYTRSAPIPMSLLKSIRQEAKVSFTAIITSTIYAALYKLHERLFPNEREPTLLQTANISAMLPYEDGLKNQFSLYPYTAPFRVPGSQRRLLETQKILIDSQTSPDPVFDYYVAKAMGSLPKFCHDILFSLSGTPVMVSNVPGFNTKLKMFDSEMVDVAAWLPLVSTTGIGIATQSYCGHLRFCAIADPSVVKDKCDLQRMVDDIVDEIHYLAKLNNVKSLHVVDPCVLDNGIKSTSCVAPSSTTTSLEEMLTLRHIAAGIVDKNNNGGDDDDIHNHKDYGNKSDSNSSSDKISCGESDSNNVRLRTTTGKSIQ